MHHKLYRSIVMPVVKCILFLDVNECLLNIHDCDQLCVNDLGSYHCECYDEYYRDENSSSCVG